MRNSLMSFKFDQMSKLLIKLRMIKQWSILIVTLTILVAVCQATRTIVESNHYYSDIQQGTNYNISNVIKDKSLVLILKKTEESPKLSNPTDFTLISGEITVVCPFLSYESLCVIKNIVNADVKMKIHCSKLPCQVSWILYQPSVKAAADKQDVQDLLEIPASENHMIAIVTCNDPKVSPKPSEIQLYSDSPFVKINSPKSHTLYYLFNNEEKGYVYVETLNQWKTCGQISVYKVPGNIDIQAAPTEIHDFVYKDSPAIYALTSNPTKDFALSGSIHAIKEGSKHVAFSIKLTGEKSGKVETIYQKNVDQKDLPKRNLDFSFTLKPIDTAYSKLQFEVSTDSIDEKNLLTVTLSQQERQEVEIGDILYFSLKKGDKLLYMLKAIDGVEAMQRAYFYLSSKEELKVSRDVCKLKEGCQFELEALQDSAGSLYLTNKQREDRVFQQQFIEIDKKVTMKIKEGDNLYFKTKLTAKRGIQVVINSPNAIVYAAEEKKCPIPEAACREKTMNINNPFLYEPTTDGVLLLNVEGIDNCEFTLTVIDEGTQFLELKDSQSFSYLMDDSEKELTFKFTIQKKEDVTFNLISPSNTFELLVSNGDTPPTDKTEDFSSEGYILFSKKRINFLTFTILVRKNQANNNKYAHFSIIASTSNSIFRLESSVAHYETITSGKHRDFVFQFSPKQKHLLNIYAHNLKGQDIKLELLASNKASWKAKGVEKIVIDQPSDVVDISEISANLCAKQKATECEIFLQLINTMDIEIDLVITLLLKNSLLELKDGVWQSFQQNQISKSINFYFQPKHIDKNIIIFYKTIKNSLKLVYNIWKTDSSSLNPSEWPFPDLSSNKLPPVPQKVIKTIVIDKDVINKLCWPDCVILLSILEDKTVPSEPKPAGTQPTESMFSIMACNSQLELPEKTRLELALQEKETRTIMVDLKYVMDKISLKFYVTSTIGLYVLKGTVSSERNQRCASEDIDADFQFFLMENILPIATIKQLLKDNGMQDDSNIFLCLSLTAYSSSKVSLEYTSEEEEAKTVELDTFQNVKISKGEKKLFKIAGNAEFQVKIMRKSGFPSILIKKCDVETELDSCLQDAKTTTDKGKQIASKTESFKEDVCSKCFYIFKFESEEDSFIVLHLQSSFSQMELKQGQILTDFTNEGESNGYLITAIRQEEVVINLQITEGNAVLKVVDYKEISIEKVTSETNSIIHLVIPAQKADKLAALGQDLTGLSSASDFSYLFLSVSSADPKVACSYIISYSSGNREIYLQDGLVADYVLDKDKESVFYYANEKQSDHVYLMISTEDTQTLEKLSIKTYFLPEIGNLDTKVEFSVQRPTLRKHTPKPTYLFLLPKQSYFMIQLMNSKKETAKVTLVINHQEVILLPFDHEFPFNLHPLEELFFLVDINIVGYLNIAIRKCDDSSPQFSYTFDYDSFLKGQFSYSTTLDGEPFYSNFLKANKIGTLYISLKSAEEVSLLSITVTYSRVKKSNARVKPGQKGILKYELSESKKAVVTFNKIICPEGKCEETYKYYSLSSRDMQSLYSQMVCPSSYFSLTDVPATETISPSEIPSKSGGNTIQFDYALLDHISYVGVKAVSKSGVEVFYNPIEIITLWGQINRTSRSHLVWIILTFLPLFIGVLIWVRRKAREGYRPLQDND